MKSVEKALPGGRGAAGAPRGAQGVRGAALAAFPDREPQLPALAAQDQVSLVSEAAHLPRGEERGQERGPPGPTPCPGMNRAGGRRLRAACLGLSGRPPPPLQELREQARGPYCTDGTTRLRRGLPFPRPPSETPALKPVTRVNWPPQLRPRLGQCERASPTLV